MKPAIPAILLSLVASGCSPKKNSEMKIDWQHLGIVQATAEKIDIDPSDGISEVEAYKIASDYFFGELRIGRGVVCIPIKEGSTWRVPLFVDVGSIHNRDLIIEINDGHYHLAKVTKNE